jgi:hypothetical protein
MAASRLDFLDGQGLAIFAQQDVAAKLMAIVRRTWFLHALWQACKDVEFFDDLCRVFNIPARLGEVLVDKL